jgi:hypothetical protein
MINSIGSKIEYITKLDLSDNDLGDEGVQLVAQGLCNSPSVNHLILNGNLSFIIVELIIRFIIYNTSLIVKQELIYAIDNLHKI